MTNNTFFNIILLHPIFSSLTKAELKELQEFITVKNFNPGSIVVAEGELVDSIYFIVDGTAEVNKDNTPIAKLHPGESIGLSETGLYAKTGKRTATVIAQTNLVLLSLKINDLNNFLKSHPHINKEMQKNAELILHMNFIKQTVPFAPLSIDQLYNLAKQVKEKIVAANVTLFHQGEKGDSCYLIRSGKVAITTDTNGSERLLAELTSPAIFGETAALLNAPRNATAKTLEPTTLLVITRKVLVETLHTKTNAADALMNILYIRSRPLRYPYIKDYHRQTADQQEIITLKDLHEDKYFRLSKEGWFIWQQLNGKNTLQEITLNFFKEFHTFNPELISSFIVDLNRAGFVAITKDERKRKISQMPLWLKLFSQIRHLMEFKLTFKNVDAWLTKTYQRGIYLLFKWPAQIILALLALIGIITFGMLFQHSVTLLGTTPYSGWLLLAVIPIGKSLCILHELGHAYATKFFGRKVKSFGIGWFWVAPIAFCDTSDMWLSPPRQRLVVDLAGLYVDVVVAGIAAIAALFVTNPYFLLFLWLFALFNYLSVFINLSPVLELDGYYALMDLFDKPNLRATAVEWLLEKFLQAIRQPAKIFQYPIELSYWILCIIFLCLEIIIPYYLMNYLLQGLLGKRDPIISLFIVLLVTIFSLLGLWSEIKRRKSTF